MCDVCACTCMVQGPIDAVCELFITFQFLLILVQQLQISQLCKDLSKSLTRESALRTLMVHLSQSDNFVEDFVKLVPKWNQ